jgi:hypothetical protein
VSAALNNVQAPDTYTTAATLSCPNTARVRLQINNQSIYWQRGYGSPGGGGIEWQPEEFLLPMTASLDERCDAIRIRAAVPAAKLPAGSEQARVTIGTRTAEELGEAP